MLFNSYIFILAFLPLCLAGYFGLNAIKQYKLAQLFLLAMSLWFYGYFNPWYLLIILVSITANYLINILMDKTPWPHVRRGEVWIAVGLNLAVLFYYKYYDFFITNLNQIAHTDFTLHHVILPLGISFFTFQQISYVVDAYHGQVPRCGFWEYASFVAYFPQLIAGPIVTHDELIPQFQDLKKKQWNWDNLAQGIFMFSLGLGKKVLIADTFGVAANWGFQDVYALDSTNAILVTLAYTIQIYFDFSGYCDMAIGIGKMMNLDLPVNFDSPYKALTITEFWQRWHKTLTRFFTKYVYIPLGGNRKGQIRTYINAMIVFLVSGLWHGASWAFVLWGGLHGAFYCVTRWKKDWFRSLHPALSWLMTFCFLNITWIFFRTENIYYAWVVIKQILTMQLGPVAPQILEAFQLPELQRPISSVPFLGILGTYPGLLIWICYGGGLALILSGKNAYQRMCDFRPTLGNMLLSAGLLLWCILSFSGISTFLYFNF